MKMTQLKQICKERKIIYASKMRKQEMIEILTQNDQDPSRKVHTEVETRMKIYRENPERRKKARECSKIWRKNNPEKAREYWFQWMEHIKNEKIQQEKELAERWRENNPEKVKEYWEKFRENYGRKNISNFSPDEEKWIKNELKFCFSKNFFENHSFLKSYLTSPIMIFSLLQTSAIRFADIFSFSKASFLVSNSSFSFSDSKTNFLNFLPLEGKPKVFLSSSFV